MGDLSAYLYDSALLASSDGTIFEWAWTPLDPTPFTEPTELFQLSLPKGATLTEIALDIRSRMYATTETGLYKVNTRNGEMTKIANLRATPNALIVGDDGLIWVGYSDATGADGFSRKGALKATLDLDEASVAGGFAPIENGFVANLASGTLGETDTTTGSVVLRSPHRVDGIEGLILGSPGGDASYFGVLANGEVWTGLGDVAGSLPADDPALFGTLANPFGVEFTGAA